MLRFGRFGRIGQRMVLILTMLPGGGGPCAADLQLPERTPRQALARFDSFVQAQGLDRDHYLLQSLSYDYVTGEWVVYYLGRGSDFDDFLYLLLNREGEISPLS